MTSLIQFVMPIEINKQKYKKHGIFLFILYSRFLKELR